MLPRLKTVSLGDFYETNDGHDEIVAQGVDR
jgi:hypothetical protein